MLYFCQQTPILKHSILNMKTTKIFLCALIVTFLSGCTSLTFQEKNTIRSLKSKGITVDKPVGPFDKPASGLTAGLLGILPGGGNFYLATGNGADSSQFVYGFINLLCWPISVVWQIPQAVVDANTINHRELVYFYTFDEGGVEALKEEGYTISNTGKLVENKDKED